MHDVVGGREIQARSARLEADEKERGRARLKGFDEGLSLLRGRRPVEIEVVDAARFELLPDEGEVARKLTEDERSVPARHQVGDEVEEGLRLRGSESETLVDQLRVTDGAAQLREFGKRLKGRDGPRFEAVRRAFAKRFVERPFVVRQRDAQRDFRLFGELFEHLRLGAAKEEGRNEALQLPLTIAVPPLFDRHDVAFGKVLVTPQKPRIREFEEVPDFAQVVLERRPRQKNPRVAREPHGGLRHLRAAVFDRVRFVEHGRRPRARSEQIRFRREYAVSNEKNLVFAGLLHGRRAVRLAVEDRDFQSRRKARNLLHPVVEDRRGRHDEGGPLLRAREEKRDRLHGLAEPHVVRKERSRPPG